MDETQLWVLGLLNSTARNKTYGGRTTIDERGSKGIRDVLHSRILMRRLSSKLYQYASTHALGPFLVFSFYLDLESLSKDSKGSSAKFIACKNTREYIFQILTVTKALL